MPNHKLESKKASTSLTTKIELVPISHSPWKKLPDDTKFCIFSFLGQRDRGRMACVNREMKGLAKETGGADYQYVTKGQRLLNAYLQQQKDTLPPEFLSHLKTPCGLMALGEGLINFDHIKKCEGYHLKDLFIPLGLIALREKLILPAQIETFPATFLQNILIPNGLTALREKLFTISQAIKFDGLSTVLTDRCLMVLREKLLTPEQISEIGTLKLEILLTAPGQEALRTQRLHLEQVKQMHCFALQDFLGLSFDQVYAETERDYKEDQALKSQQRRCTF
jgi:hypothetical protein